MDNIYTDTPLRPSGGRRVPRPARVEPCPLCHGLLGRNYFSCSHCLEVLDRIWLADWEALLAEEGSLKGSPEEKMLADIVLDDMDEYPWTIVDVALSLITCPECGSELGGGPVECGKCQMAFNNLFVYDIEASYQGQMTGNEHALRVGRWILRYPHRYSNFVAKGWKNSMPLLLINATPPSSKIAQFLSQKFKEGKYLPDKIYQSFEEAYEDLKDK